MPVFASLIFVPACMGAEVRFSRKALVLGLPSGSIATPAPKFPFAFAITPVENSPMPSAELPLA